MSHRGVSADKEGKRDIGTFLHRFAPVGVFLCVGGSRIEAPLGATKARLIVSLRVHIRVYVTVEACAVV